MKRLDDVIKALEKCMADDAIESEGGYLATDALHYLKEYRDAKNALDIEREKCIKTYCQWQDAKEKLEAQTSHMMWVDNHFQFEISDNLPLTWDELKQMKGKPIWVEYSGYTPNWEIVENTNIGAAVETNMSILHKEDQGTTWQAYRKEKNEII